jgi:hypothetical protein
MELRRGAPMKRTGRIKPRKRSASEFARVYGSRARVAWIKGLPCIACVAASPLFGMPGASLSHNAHTVSGGQGRKADAATIVPLCASHHRRYDEYKAPFDYEPARDAMKRAAARIDAEWDRIENAA